MLPLEMQVDPETDEQSACTSSCSGDSLKLQLQLQLTTIADRRTTSFACRGPAGGRSVGRPGPRRVHRELTLPHRQTAKRSAHHGLQDEVFVLLAHPPLQSTVQHLPPLHNKLGATRKEEAGLLCHNCVEVFAFFVTTCEGDHSAGRERAMYNPYGVVRLIGWFGIDWGSSSGQPSAL